MIRDDLRKAVTTAIAKLYGTEYLEVEISDAQTGFGDFSTNVAFSLARQLGKAPKIIAGELSAAIVLLVIESCEPAGAGFINFYLSENYWVQKLKEIGPDFAKLSLGSGTKVQVEYISANPTGPTTIGNARGGFLGEVLSRVLERAGYDVTREYYFNNAGTQISKLLESVKMQAGLIPESDERQYRGSYIEKLAHEFKTQLATESDGMLKELLTQTILNQYIKPAIEKMGIEFDVWFNENDLINDGSFDETIKKLRELGLVFERDGAVWLKTGELGDERPERVIIKSNGDPTYMAPDIAYHVNIFGKRGFDYAIKVLGPDHVAQFPSVYAAVHQLFPDVRFRMAGYQWLRVVREGKEVKVSKRLGQFITVEDLIDQVGQPVALFLTLMRASESHMDFDLSLAAETSSKNPYYYVMYAYARANSILIKAKERGLIPAPEVKGINMYAAGIVRTMDRLPGMIEMMAEDFGVHRLTFYGLEIAKQFTEYYDKVKIIDLDPEIASQELFFVQRFIIFMELYWSLLGIEPVTRMDRSED